MRIQAKEESEEMAVPEQIRQTAENPAVTHDSINIFSAHTTSLKVCLTETHIDCTIQNNQIFDYNHKPIDRNDRKIHGGGVLIAINESFTSK